jgi:hypothetical protein
MKPALRSNAERVGIASLALCAALALVAVSRTLAAGRRSQSAAQIAASRISSIRIVLPPRLVAGRPATLATLGADHRLIGHVAVGLGNGKSVETDATGRANFTAPSGSVLIARAGAGSAAALIDSPSSMNAHTGTSVPPFAALHDSFDICGAGFDGNAETNRVQVNEEPALVLAASPECLVIIPGPAAAPGVTKIAVEGASPAQEDSVTLVALTFQPPQPPLTPGKKGWLTVRAHGSSRPLRIVVENGSFDVLQFDGGDTQELTTSGGGQNAARIRVQAIRSGDFSFQARILPPPDPEAGRRFLEIAEPLAMGDLPHTLKRMAGELAHHPKDAEKIRTELDRMLEVTSPSDFRTLLEAARSAL